MPWCQINGAKSTAIHPQIALRRDQPGVPGIPVAFFRARARTRAQHRGTQHQHIAEQAPQRRRYPTLIREAARNAAIGIRP